MLLDLTELSSYLPLVSSFEFGNASGKLFPCTEGRVRTIMVPPGTPRGGAFVTRGVVSVEHISGVVMLADILTKATSRGVFVDLLKQLDSFA